MNSKNSDLQEIDSEKDIPKSGELEDLVEIKINNISKNENTIFSEKNDLIANQGQDLKIYF